MNRIEVYGNEIRVGDEFENLWFKPGFTQVKSLEPYRGTLLNILGEGTQIASFWGTNAKMTLPAKEWMLVTRP
jgi:hypothetical protein